MRLRDLPRASPTWARVIDRAALKPSAQGARGPLFRLRDALGAMVDSGFLGVDADRSRLWGHDEGRESGARELAERVVDALAKRFDPVAMRLVREVMASELHAHIVAIYERGEAHIGAPLDWPKLSDAELEAALRELIEEGCLPYGDEEKA